MLTDIDDTLTDEGLLGREAYSALWDLRDSGIQVIPVTGRPAGWCELIVRQWPVSAVVGENGAFWFRYHEQKMIRHFSQSEEDRLRGQKKLTDLQEIILREVPGSAVASDQFCRLFDLAIDYCEDVPALARKDIDKIVELFKSNGATAKVSSIHINGWFGHFDKLSASLNLLQQEFNLEPEQMLSQCGFVGDSLNDEPMWGHFPNSFAVANVKVFAQQLKTPPQFVANSRGGQGFAEIARILLANSGQP